MSNEQILQRLMTIERDIKDINQQTIENKKDVEQALEIANSLSEHTESIIRMGVAIENLTTVMKNTVKRLETIERRPSMWMDRIINTVLSVVIVWLLAKGGIV